MENGRKVTDKVRSGGAVMGEDEKAIFQTVFMYGSESWVVTGAILTVI